MTGPDAEAWWREGVLYQLYPRSFADGNADGIGDLRGLLGTLDYLAWLGIDGIWLTPIMPSPGADWGYDVSDYLDVDPAFGTLADLDGLVAAAGARGIRVLLDLVPNHTSDRHPWFIEARSGRDSPRRDWYVWAGSKADGAQPNNWLSAFGGPAWTLDEASGEHYLHHFLPQQPDLNWWNKDVRAAFDEILRFWFERGIAGFRIDVPHFLLQDRRLRDNPPAERPLVGASPRPAPRVELHAARAPRRPAPLARARRRAGARACPRRRGRDRRWRGGRVLRLRGGRAAHDLPPRPRQRAVRGRRAPRGRRGRRAPAPTAAQPLWTLGNHDIARYGTRWGEDDPRRARAALVLLFGLRGTPTLYYGDELGLGDVPVPAEAARDPEGRDPQRTPMPWSPAPGAGFTVAGVEPWLPIGDRAGLSVAEQRDDPGSPLSLARDLVALRRRSVDLRTGAYEPLPSPAGAWAWRRGAGTAVAVNLTGEERVVEGITGTVAVATARERDGERVGGRLVLAPWEGAIVSG